MIPPTNHVADSILSAAIDEQLTLEEAREAQPHLEACPACRARLDELRSVVGLLRALPLVEPPRDFSIGPRLVADPPNVIRLRRWYAVARAGAGSLAAAFVVLSAGALYVGSQPSQSELAYSTAAENTAARQSAPAAAARPASTSVKAAAPAVKAAAPAAAPASAAAPAAPAPAPASALSAQSGAGKPAPAQSAGAAADSAARPAAPAAPPAAGGSEIADQVTATTSVEPLPTAVPTLAPTPAPLLPAVAQPPLPTAAAGAPPPLRSAAALVGILAALGLLVTLIVRRRLRAAAATSSKE